MLDFTPKIRRKSSKRKPIFPPKRMAYQERRLSSTPRSHDPIRDALVKGLEYRHSRVRCARRLMSDYTVGELGYTIYMRCYRALKSRRHPDLHRVRDPRKPGRVTDGEQKVLQSIDVTREISRIIDEYDY